MDNCINVVYITDEKYAVFACVSISSLISNMDKEDEVQIFVICSALSDLSKERLAFLRGSGVHIELIEVCDQKNLKLIKESACKVETYVSEIAMLKFNLPDILQSVDKVIYFDCDILIQKSIKHLFNCKLGDQYIAAVDDMLDVEIEGYSMLAKRIGLKRKDYFNSGVMVLNLRKMRADAITEQLLEYRESGINYFMDQDALNAVLGERRVKLPCIYNFMSTATDAYDIDLISEKFFAQTKRGIEECIDTAVVIHLTGIRKPWEYCMPWFSNIFMKYYKGSPYSKDALYLKSPVKELLDEFYSMKNSYASRINHLMKVSEAKDFVVPYERIKKDCRLILYGAGKVGKSYYRQLTLSQYCDVIMVVDKRGTEAGEGIKDAFEIRKAEYDYILVAIKNRNFALEVIDFLVRDLAVANNKIIHVIDEIK